MGISSFLSTPFGGLLTGVGEKLWDNHSARSAATQSFNREKWMMQNRYQLQVGDLKKSGLNPALAYGQSAPMPAAPMGQMSKGGLSHAVGGGSSAMIARAQVRALEAETGLKQAQTKTELNRPENVVSSTGVNVASAARASQETVNLRIQLEKIAEEIKLVRAETYKKGAEAQTIDRMRELDARIKILEGKGMTLRMPENEARGAVGQRIVEGNAVIGDNVLTEVGHKVGGYAADVRDKLVELKGELEQMWSDVQKRRKARGDALRKGR